MNLIPKRLLLVGAAPLAIAAVYGGSIAFAQSGEDSTQTPTPSGDAAPQTPTGPDGTTPGGKAGCDHMGGGSGSSDSQSTDSGTSSQIRTRARIGTSSLY